MISTHPYAAHAFALRPMQKLEAVAVPLPFKHESDPLVKQSAAMIAASGLPAASSTLLSKDDLWNCASNLETLLAQDYWARIFLKKSLNERDFPLLTIGLPPSSRRGVERVNRLAQRGLGGDKLRKVPG